jgi:predicted SAM-dependent methyltransferase
MKKPVRCLNIGSGAPKGLYKEEHWINIDVHHIKGVIQMSAFDMPNSWTDRFREVRAIHCLEHVNRNQRLEFVQHCLRVTEPGCFCFIEVPNFKRTIMQLMNAFESGDKDLEHRMTTSIFGKQRYDGDQHCWGFTWDTLYDLCMEAGAEEVEIFRGCMTDHACMISDHYRQEDVLLARLLKKKR